MGGCIYVECGQQGWYIVAVQHEIQPKNCLGHPFSAPMPELDPVVQLVRASD